MTNREWLQTLTDEEFVQIMCYSCDCCVGHSSICQIKCGKTSCRNGRIEWLQQEHKENDSL